MQVRKERNFLKRFFSKPTSFAVFTVYCKGTVLALTKNFLQQKKNNMFVLLKTSLKYILLKKEIDILMRTPLTYQFPYIEHWKTDNVCS